MDIEAVPVQGRSSGQLCFLVLFSEPPDVQRGPEQPPPTLPRREADRQIAHLERELASTQQYLQAVIEDQSAANEELQAANEEILSSNEELQSLNEELETAKEELQSSNEELNTLNEELQNRNLELDLLGDDLINLLSSLHIPVVLLSPDLRLRRFTPAAARLMNLLPADVNRPLNDIRPNFDLPSLEVAILEAIETVTLIEREVQDRQGCWYSLRIRPYKTRDNRIDGAVMVLVDVDALKRGAVEVAEARDFADAIIETVREPLLVLDAELRVERANRNFYDSFRVRREETEGRLLKDLGNGQWNVPELREALRSILADDHEIQDFEVEREIPADRPPDDGAQCPPGAAGRSRSGEDPGRHRGPDGGQASGGGARPAGPPGRGGQPAQGRVPGHGLTRAARPLERHGRVGPRAGGGPGGRGDPRPRAGGDRSQRPGAGAAHRGSPGRRPDHDGEAAPVSSRDRPAAGGRGGRRDRARGGRRQGRRPRARARRRASTPSWAIRTACSRSPGTCSRTP